MFNPVTWVQSNPWYAIAGYYAFSAAVSAMPEPNNSGKFYLWAYRFLHLLSANIDKLAQSSKVTAAK